MHEHVETEQIRVYYLQRTDAMCSEGGAVGGCCKKDGGWRGSGVDLMEEADRPHALCVRNTERAGKKF